MTTSRWAELMRALRLAEAEMWAEKGVDPHLAKAWAHLLAAQTLVNDAQAAWQAHRASKGGS